MEAILNIDHQLLWWVYHNLRNPVLTTFVQYFTILINSPIFWGLLIAIALFFRRTRLPIVVVLLAATVALGLGDGVFKQLAQRTRPIFSGAEVAAITELPKVTSYSFPSGHSIVTAAMAAVVWMHHKSWGILAILFALLVGFSRIYAFVHYPLDVVTGLVLGFIMGVIVHKVVKHFEYLPWIQKFRDFECIKSK